MNREKLVSGVRVCRHFINNSLGLSRDNAVSGFELAAPLLSAAAHNTYVETVSNKADTLYLRAKESMTEMVTHEYIDCIKRWSVMFGWKNKGAMLALDYTEEDFYGDVQGLDIHGWKKGEAITGKFKFLTCNLISDEIPEKIPLISIPIQIGHNMSYAVIYCIKAIEPYIGQINLILFDRGFYSKELMYELQQFNLPYLILARKGKDDNYITEELAKMQKNEKKITLHTYDLNKDKTYYEFESKLVFLKSIFTKTLNKEIDWVFVTNLNEVQLDTIIQTYRKRWRIETGYRVQDEATIKCKSKEMKIRYFLFLFQQLLQAQWACFYKSEVSFKKYLIEIYETCKSLTEHPMRPHGKSIKA